MKCPYCGYTTSKVLDSRSSSDNDAIKRRRQCEKCNKRFTTYEQIELIPLMVVKRDGSREVFERNKLLGGILRSCNKRNISIVQIEELVDSIENMVYARENKEVESLELGELTMLKLKELDEVSYIRFASVYKQFVCIDEFIAELNSIKAIKK